MGIITAFYIYDNNISIHYLEEDESDWISCGVEQLEYDERPETIKRIKESYADYLDRMIVAGKTIIRDKLSTYDIEVDDYDYPDELKSFLGRNIWVDKFDNVLSSSEMWPIFVKPIRNKAFTGFVLRSETDVP